MLNDALGFFMDLAEKLHPVLAENILIGKGTGEYNKIQITQQRRSSNDYHDAAYSFRNEETGTAGFMGIGTGGVNNGLWSDLINAWAIYSNAKWARVYRRPTVSNISAIVTAASGITITAAAYTERAGVAQLHIAWKSSSAISVPASGNITNVVVGTLASEIRPPFIHGAWSHGDYAGAAWYYFDSTGKIQLGACEGTGSARTIAAGTEFHLFTTYIIS